MSLSDAELVGAVHRRARRALLAVLGALNALPARQRQRLQTLGSEVIHEALLLGVLRCLVLSFGHARGLAVNDADYRTGRLFRPVHALLEIQPRVAESGIGASFPEGLLPARDEFLSELGRGLIEDGVDFASAPAELLGNAYELLLAETIELGPQGASLASAARRKQTGTFFTPRSLTEVVVARALEGASLRSPSELRICDPAVGGGAFLIQAGRALATDAVPRSALVRNSLCGVDVNPVAVAVAEAALWLFAEDPTLSLRDAGRHLRVGDALSLDFAREFPELFPGAGFDLVLGNPPWVAYAGRAAKPLAPARKAYLLANYSTLRGYPTLHGLFVECALRMAARGSVALVVPSPIADLQGYRAVRRAVRLAHVPAEPLLEFGQDAFASVTQPCFALIAHARPSGSTPTVDPDPDAPLRLAERQRAGAAALEVAPPSALGEVARLPPFPRELFGEMGFQTTSIVTQTLLLRAPEPDALHHYPLLEGRDVREFSVGQPRLFLAPDREQLARARCRLRAAADYQRVTFVVRQTARFPIAARHPGLPFRNSLLAGFEVDGLPADLVVGLLNSSLYRALHLALRRDARQAAFPQVKVLHLRALPAPPDDPTAREEIASLSGALSREGVRPTLTEALDGAVFRLFRVDDTAAREVRAFLSARNGVAR